MTSDDIVFSRKSGKISHRGYDLISYQIDLPSILAEGFPNRLFESVAEKYLKYLERLAKCRLVPEYEKMRDKKMRIREIKRSLKTPIEARLVWRATHVGERYLSLTCKTRLCDSEGGRVFTLKAITFDSENMTVARLGDLVKGRRKRGKFFFLKEKNLYVFKKGRAFADSETSAEQKMGVRLCNMNNKRVRNL